MNELNEIVINKNFFIGQKIENFYKNLSWNNKHAISSNDDSFLITKHNPIVLLKELMFGGRQHDLQETQALIETFKDNSKYGFYPNLSPVFLPPNNNQGVLSYNSTVLPKHILSLSKRMNVKSQNQPTLSASSSIISTETDKLHNDDLSHYRVSSQDFQPDTAELQTNDDDKTSQRLPSNIFQSILTRYLRLPLSLSTSPNFIKNTSSDYPTRTSLPVSENKSNRQNSFTNYIQNKIPFIANMFPFIIKQKSNVIQTNSATRGISFLPSEIFQFLNFSSFPSDVQIQTGTFANEITKYYNADALTLNKTIFLSGNYNNLYSPESVAIIGHELTHIAQQQEINNFRKPVTPLRRNFLEKQAFQNEQIILDHSLRSKNSISTPKNNNLTKNKFSVSQREINSNTRLSSNNSTLSNSDLSFPTNFAFNNPEFLNSVHNPNLLAFQKFPISGEFIQQENFFNSNISEYPTNSSSPELHYAHTPNQTSETPLLATSDRNSGSSSSESASQPADNSSPESNPVSLDFDTIAEKVYELLKDNVKTERERRGYSDVSI